MSNILSRYLGDRLLIWLLRVCASIAGAVALLIIIFLAIESLPALRHIGITRFFTDTSWHPAPRADQGQFNLTPMLWGTLIAMSGAVCVATPIGILSAVFCHYYVPPAVARYYRRMIEVLAGVPSVVFGFWGLVVLVPLIRQLAPPGPSLLAGIIVLTIMILPTIALTADVALANVPRGLPPQRRGIGDDTVGSTAWRGLPSSEVGFVYWRNLGGRTGDWRDDGRPDGLWKHRSNPQEPI